jgi:hypothetical protein
MALACVINEFKAKSGTEEGVVVVATDEGGTGVLLRILRKSKTLNAGT